MEIPRRYSDAPKAAPDCGEYRQAAGADGKALKLWGNDPAAYPFDSNNVVAITRVLFQSRHAWFCPHQYRYCVGGCSGAVLGMSVALSEIISGAPEIRSRLQHHRQRPDG